MCIHKYDKMNNKSTTPSEQL